MSLKSDLVLPSDGIKLQLTNVRAFIGERDYGTGTLCVAENELIWILENGQGLQFNYPQIGLHAISTDLNAFPHECLYMIVDKSALNSSSEEREGEDNDEEDNDEISPLRFVPADKTYLQPLFGAINECQALHPDPEADISEGDEDEDDNGDEHEEEDNENDFRNAEDDDEDVAGVVVDENEDRGGEEIDVVEQFDAENVQLSARGRQIWERLTRGQHHQQQSGNNNENKNGDDPHMTEENAQFQDADIADDSS